MKNTIIHRFRLRNYRIGLQKRKGREAREREEFERTTLRHFPVFIIISGMILRLIQFIISNATGITKASSHKCVRKGTRALFRHRTRVRHKSLNWNLPLQGDDSGGGRGRRREYR